tara:strand:+ start:125 stop:652 length:528 start_codon:yes stop_codon:yes gene_type:complete
MELTDILVHDDFFDLDLQKDIFIKLCLSGWTYTGGGETNVSGTKELSDSRFWHLENLERDEYYNTFLYEKIYQKINIKFSGVNRIYANGQTACQGGNPHTDDGDFTFLYYPCLEWKNEWQGNLVFMNDSADEVVSTVTYKPNRAVLFPTNIVHYADAPSRFFKGLRISLAYKLWN